MNKMSILQHTKNIRANTPNVDSSFTVLGEHEGLKFIELSKILFDEKVADMVESNNSTFPPELLNNLFATSSFPLTQKRLCRVLEGYDIGLPPIFVKKSLGDKYTLQNGRHRVTAAILFGDSIIPSIVEK